MLQLPLRLIFRPKFGPDQWPSRPSSDTTSERLRQLCLPPHISVSYGQPPTKEEDSQRSRQWPVGRCQASPEEEARTRAHGQGSRGAQGQVGWKEDCQAEVSRFGLVAPLGGN